MKQKKALEDREDKKIKKTNIKKEVSFVSLSRYRRDIKKKRRESSSIWT
jgi:hypothetical protein